MQYTSFVTRQDHQKITHLRQQEYAKAKGFELDLSSLSWSKSDEESFVMALKNNDDFIATMRGEIINDQAILEKKLECSWIFPTHLNFPVLLLSRAATDSQFHSKGLNLIQRYWFLRFAQHHQIQFVLGTFVQGSPREKTLREMGYDFFINEKGWQESSYRSMRPVNVVVLDMKKNGLKAIEYCESNIDVHSFPMIDNFPELKLMTTL